jgi:hypothetical protein
LPKEIASIIPNDNSYIYQFKITLKGTKKKIWRRVQVPSNYNFWDLHVAIQDVMGWLDYHLHQFEVINPNTGDSELIGMPDDEDHDRIISGEKAKISDYFLSAKDKSNYTYDFGDSWKWEHEVVLENILLAIAGDKYPQCIDGERSCPPEDCGGVCGHERLLEVIANPNHPEYEERMEWLGDDFSPGEFDPKVIEFSDPKKR